MDKNFWLKRWEISDIGFHQHEANPHLVNYFKRLSLVRGSRVFFPLCGKTLDIAWLLSNDYRVVGVELSEVAINQLFSQFGVQPEITVVGKLRHYSAKNIDVFVGDIFELSSEVLGPVDAIYDRAALVALPKEMRIQYTAHLMEIAHKAPQLLINFEYDQDLMEGPPFSVSNEEVHQHYRGCYNVSLIFSSEVVGGLKGVCPAKENVWLLNIG